MLLNPIWVMLLNRGRPTFLVDAMLGNIAKKLRLLGYDSYYSSNVSDDEVIFKAKKEGRVIITKDEQLVKSAERNKIPTIQIDKNDEVNQLVQIFQNQGLPKFVLDTNTTRCTVCNGQLYSVNKDKILSKVPKGVIENTENFWECDTCNKIYWEGTHIDRLQKFVVELNEKL